MNLTQTARAFKLGIKVFAGIVVTYYIFTLVLIPTAKKLYRMIIRPIYPPNVAFGQLDQLEFVQKEIQGQVGRYVLNTKNGALPDDFPVKVLVYKINRPSLSYLAADKAIRDAATLGYIEKDLISDLKGNIFKWRSAQTNGVLEINKDNGIIKLDTVLNKSLERNLTKNLSEKSAGDKAMSIFGSLERFGSNYDRGIRVVTLGKFSGERVNQAITKIDGQVGKVELYRFVEVNRKTKYKITGPDPYKGLLHVVVGTGTEKSPFGYLSMEAYYKEVNFKSEATYPIIEVEAAWEAVKSGRGVLAGIKPTSQSPFAEYTPLPIETILINSVSLAYYESTRYQPYLQPIFVFEGKFGSRSQTSTTNSGDVTIYFPAVSGEYVKK